MAALMRSCIAAQVCSCYSLHSDTFHSRRSRIVKLLHRPTPVLVRTYICLSFDLVGSNPQTTHLWSIKGAFLQQWTWIFWNTVALMARKPIRLCAKWCNRLTVKVCFFSRLSELAEQLRVTVFVGIPQINLFHKFCSLMALETKYKHSESCRKLQQTVCLRERYRSEKNQIGTQSAAQH